MILVGAGDFSPGASTTVLATQHQSPHRSFNPRREPLPSGSLPHSPPPTIFLLTHCTASKTDTIGPLYRTRPHYTMRTQHCNTPLPLLGLQPRGLAGAAPSALGTPNIRPSLPPYLFLALLENYPEKAWPMQDDSRVNRHLCMVLTCVRDIAWTEIKSPVAVTRDSQALR